MTPSPSSSNRLLVPMAALTRGADDTSLAIHRTLLAHDGARNRPCRKFAAMTGTQSKLVPDSTCVPPL
jgi:hypothetical protein